MSVFCQSYVFGLIDKQETQIAGYTCGAFRYVFPLFVVVLVIFTVLWMVVRPSRRRIFAAAACLVEADALCVIVMAFSGFTMPSKHPLVARPKAQPRGGIRSAGGDRMSPMTPVEPHSGFKCGLIIYTNMMWCRCMVHRRYITYYVVGSAHHRPCMVHGRWGVSGA